ncbi:MAG: hypothetical protein F6K42_10935 [Leptolyngbya sp. SIO1D8]|nr:hypothetical protein [Leptolyngbya sp. SIO1D8]
MAITQLLKNKANLTLDDDRRAKLTLIARTMADVGMQHLQKIKHEVYLMNQLDLGDGGSLSSFGGADRECAT